MRPITIFIAATTRLIVRLHGVVKGGYMVTIISVVVLFKNRFNGQSRLHLWLVGGVPKAHTKHWVNMSRQAQQFAPRLGVVTNAADIANTQPFRLL